MAYSARRPLLLPTPNIILNELLNVAAIKSMDKDNLTGDLISWRNEPVQLSNIQRVRSMSNTQEKHVARIAQSKGYTLEKVGKGAHHGRFSLINQAQGSRAHSGIAGAEFSFSLQEAEDWLTTISLDEKPR